MSNLVAAKTSGKSIWYNSNIWLICALIVVFGLLSLFVPNFMSSNNLLNIIIQTGAVGLITIGLTFVLITGGIDLSAPSLMAVAAVIGADYMVKGGSIFIGCLIMVAVATLGGFINGFAVAKLGMIPLVVTLSMMVITGGLAVWYTKAQSVFGLPDGYIDTLTGEILGIPVPLIVLLVFGVLAHVLLSRTIYGRWVYALGLNEKTARVSGMPTRKVLLSVYALSGLFAGLAAILLTARLGSASASMGPDTFVLDVISAAVIGGISIYGGTGSIVGAVGGALFITMIGNSMNLAGVSYYTTLVIKGIIIILATGFDRFRSRLR